MENDKGGKPYDNGLTSKVTRNINEAWGLYKEWVGLEGDLPPDQIDKANSGREEKLKAWYDLTGRERMEISKNENLISVSGKKKRKE